MADQGVGSFVPEKGEMIGLLKKKSTHEEYSVRKLMAAYKRVETLKKHIRRRRDKQHNSHKNFANERDIARQKIGQIGRKLCTLATLKF